MVRRKPPEWMSQTHERILEYLSELDEDEDEWAGPKEIAEEFDRNRDYISRETVKMGQAGFVLVIGQGGYQITDKGKHLLSGEEDFRQVPNPRNESDSDEDINVGV